ncbi:carboxymuconolactone decarboxylase family protein [Nonomuraea sp. NPDC050783]|uniref:carboxymuconolactone decarboxylase family protein n=1 Tax=Nonomuraea sp. NPDC050783 TaxID=3154634 RepID=UPI00346627BE
MSGFLRPPETTPEVRRLYDEDLAEHGHVMNLTRLWAHQPDTVTGLFDLLRQSVEAGGLDLRTRGVLVTACASALGDSYCSLAWGGRLAESAGARTAAGVLRGDDDGLTPRERVLARWARMVARDPNGIGQADVGALREAGFDDGRIFAITVFVALRVAFSTVNDALGARPDAALRDAAPRPVLEAVTFGRPIEDRPTEDRPTEDQPL